MTDESPSQTPPVIRLRSPEELLASLPQLLGFRPADSVILIADVEQGSAGSGPVMRCDLPDRSEQHAVARQMVEAITRSTPGSVLIIVVGGGDATGSAGIARLPQRSLVQHLRHELRQWGLEQPAAMWVPQIVGGVGWLCYDHATCGGVLPDPDSTIAAARVVDLGLVTFDSREELRRLLEQDDDEQQRTRTTQLARQLRARAGPDSDTRSLERGMATVREALERAHAQDFGFTDEQLIELALALTDRRVRDACLATALPPTSETALLAANLWQELTRRLPEPERAHAACLAGYAAYMRGEGALAGMAMEIALAADPDHVLAALLIRAFQSGLPPRTLQQLAQSSEHTLWP